MPRKILLLIIVLIFSIYRDSTPADETGKCILWKIEDDNSFVYLLGSVHIANQSFYPLNSAYYEAYSKTDSLAIEADAENINNLEIQKTIAERGIYPDGKTLQQSISKKTLKAYKEYLKSQGLNTETTTNTKPWLLSLTLLTIELQKMGFYPQFGIDRHFITKAKMAGKKIIELESAESQINLISGFSDELQEMLLFYTFKDIQNLKDAFTPLINSWKDGDTGSLDNYLNKTFNESPEMKPLWDKIIFDRNINFAKKIESFLADDKLCMVIVGAAHITGKKGILDLFKNKPFKIEQIAKNK